MRQPCGVKLATAMEQLVGKGQHLPAAELAQMFDGVKAGGPLGTKILGQYVAALTSLVGSGHPEVAAQMFGDIADQAKKQGISVEDLSKKMPTHTEALGKANAEQDLAKTTAVAQADAVFGVTVRYDSAYALLGSYLTAIHMSTDDIKAATKQVQDWGTALGDFIDPVGAYTTLLDAKNAAEQKTAQATADATASTTDSWPAYAKAVHVSLDEYLAELNKQVKAQEDWATNMLILSSRVSAGTIDYLEKQGIKAAPLVEQMVHATDGQLSHFDDDFQKRTKDATRAKATTLYEAGPLLSAIAAKNGQGVANALATELGKGTTTVAEIARQYGYSLDTGLTTPVVNATEKVGPLEAKLRGLDGVTSTAHINILVNGLNTVAGVASKLANLDAGVSGQARGSVLDFFAAGGLRENRVAQIASAGAMRVWAEPETGGEAYIPLATSKRPRSVAIGQQTGAGWGSTRTDA
ncbi:MAG: hypothetical protein JWQ74_1070 [Marmoricola sp.]|nr:hypothetical protein [Marmoricola sp.]